MQAKQINLYPLTLQLKAPFKTAHDVTYQRPLTLVEIVDASGVKGYGDVQSFIDHGYAPENQAESVAEIKRLVPALLAMSFVDASAVSRWLAEHSTLSFAKAALEMAFWDIDGKRRNMSLATMLGGTAIQTQVAVGIAIGMQADWAATYQQVAAAVTAGYRRIKLKIDAATDLTALGALIADFPGQLFSVDANAAWQPADQPRLKALADAGVYMLEQPFHETAWAAHERAQRAVPTLHLSLDESLNNESDVQRALQNRTTDALTLKQGKIGGIWVTKQAITSAQQAQLRPWIGGMLSSGVGRAADLALAAQPGANDIPSDSSSSSRYFVRDIIMEQTDITAGCLPVPMAPGLGVTIDWQAVHGLQSGPTVQFQ